MQGYSLQTRHLQLDMVILLLLRHLKLLEGTIPPPPRDRPRSWLFWKLQYLECLLLLFQSCPLALCFQMLSLCFPLLRQGYVFTHGVYQIIEPTNDSRLAPSVATRSIFRFGASPEMAALVLDALHTKMRVSTFLYREVVQARDGLRWSI
ncbi:hypothetical protein M758_3G001000 [Ceratodon purpureus]|uniref:Uncharacterized protein n=1 Tax=Ceratodon purpureus TaxID=3225 RepID=A0A8T0IGW0_CERPU|nr:hypothetical protein KC19_3G000800 [Ceratodon purpureus]KAG0621193.1 hypothetical protein M758_3G001000 [Ceratodon purpureus]